MCLVRDGARKRPSVAGEQRRRTPRFRTTVLTTNFLRGGTMKTQMFRAGLSALGALALGVVAGCSSVPEVTKDRVARSETTVQQAEQTVGRSEAGAVELQRAKDNLEQARAALKKAKREP